MSRMRATSRCVMTATGWERPFCSSHRNTRCRLPGPTGRRAEGGGAEARAGKTRYRIVSFKHAAICLPGGAPHLFAPRSDHRSSCSARPPSDRGKQSEHTARMHWVSSDPLQLVAARSAWPSSVVFPFLSHLFILRDVVDAGGRLVRELLSHVLLKQVKTTSRWK